MRIGIIIGSTRPGRKGEAVAHWVHELAGKRPEAVSGEVSYELVDLKDFGLVLLDEATVPGAANRQYEREETRAWSSRIDELDGFVFVTAEYNHGIPAAFKNAFDVIYPEWSNKAVGFVSYGADGGVRSVEHWRAVVANAHLHAVRGQVSLSLFTDWSDNGFTPAERRADEVAAVLDQVVPLAGALRSLR